MLKCTLDAASSFFMNWEVVGSVELRNKDVKRDETKPQAPLMLSASFSIYKNQDTLTAV